VILAAVRVVQLSQMLACTEHELRTAFDVDAQLWRRTSTELVDSDVPEIRQLNRAERLRQLKLLIIRPEV
jgi:hypothetical protein